jgi:MtN3 and saliva related transmembrane protein
MLVILTSGLLLWVCYGLLMGDRIIIVANGVSGALSATVMSFKIRDLRGQS